MVVARARETGCLLRNGYRCDDFSDIATCPKLESIALLLPAAYSSSSACTSTNTVVAERMIDCPMSQVIIKADFSPHDRSSHLACIDLNLELGRRVERLDIEVIVSQAVVRGKAVVEAAPNHRVANVAAGGYLTLEVVESRNGFDTRTSAATAYWSIETATNASNRCRLHQVHHGGGGFWECNLGLDTKCDYAHRKGNDQPIEHMIWGYIVHLLFISRQRRY